MPKLTPEWHSHNPGPDPRAGDDCGPYAAWPIADALGFRTLGVAMERLPPGSKSSLRHHHSAEEEVVYVVEGTLVLVEDTETTLHPGDVAAWAAGQGVAHCLENRSDADAVILVAGTRGVADTVTYPDHDLVKHCNADGTETVTRLDGTPFDGDG
ncbi:MAG: cupin domain-containing protein [Pseudomonadota bacterium]